MTHTRNPEVLRLKLGSKRLPQPLVEAVRRVLQRGLGFDEFNAVYGRLPPCNAATFSRTFIEALGVQLDLAGEPVDTIPAAGPLIVIANHPFGIIEGMALDALLLSHRADFTVMAIRSLEAIPEYRRLIFVDPQKSRRERGRNARSMRQAHKWLRCGGAMCIFPAGRVARFQWRRMAIADQPWSPHVAALARSTGAQVLPIYVHGSGCWSSRIAGALCPPLQNLAAVGAVSKMRGQTLRATIGPLISPTELSRFGSDEEAIAILRRETEGLANGDNA